jgi:hypothetical protein
MLVSGSRRVLLLKFVQSNSIPTDLAFLSKVITLLHPSRSEITIIKASLKSAVALV